MSDQESKLPAKQRELLEFLKMAVTRLGDVVKDPDSKKHALYIVLEDTSKGNDQESHLSSLFSGDTGFFQNTIASLIRTAYEGSGLSDAEATETVAAVFEQLLEEPKFGDKLKTSLMLALAPCSQQTRQSDDRPDLTPPWRRDKDPGPGKIVH